MSVTVGVAVSVAVAVIVGVGVSVAVAVAVGVAVSVGVGVGVSVTAAVSVAARSIRGPQAAISIAADKIRIKISITVLFSMVISVTGSRISLKFIKNFRQVVFGIIKSTRIITCMGIIANSVVEAILRYTINIFAAIRAIVLMVIDRVINQIRIVVSLKNLHGPG